MPSLNVIKEYVPNSFYHVYARGVGKQKIYFDAKDYQYFYYLINRYLSKKPTTSKTGIIYPNFNGAIKIMAYCLMQNHFHLLIFQQDSYDMQKFMHSLMTSYGRYFNLRYKRTGPVFDSRYKASRIDKDQYLMHITRYIHLNPRRWEQYNNSSLKYYMGDPSPEWLYISPILNLFSNKEKYLEFLADYEDFNYILEELKHNLADQK